MAKRRGFLKALVATTAAGAATVVTQAPIKVDVPPPPTVIKQVMEWPKELPPLVHPPSDETEREETLRLLQMLLDAERVMLYLPQATEITWNGLQFRVAKGPNVVPAPIANIWKQCEIDRQEGERELFQSRQSALAKKYSHTYTGRT